MLENACMKEETTMDAGGDAVSMGEQSRGPSSLVRGGTAISGKTIEEVHDES